MSIYDINGNIVTASSSSYKLVGAVLDASSEANRFLAMKQLFDIAKEKIKNPDYIPSDSDFSYATKGAVCVMPDFPAMYENYPLDVIYAKNASIQGLPASTTKVWSAAVALPYINIMDKYTIASADVQTGSGNYFSAGDILSFEDILYGMFLSSSNTCAMALAHHVGSLILGDNSASASNCVDAFVAEMNARANLIGCTNTAFDTPSGLSTTNKTTASDLLRMLITASSFHEIQKIWNKKEYSISVKGSNARSVSIQTTVENETLESSYYIFGGKTGHLNNSADALVMIAEEL